MAQRKQIALIFSYNENWIGGTYYILNLIHSLNTLPEQDKPYITICSEKESEFSVVRKETSYPHLNYFNTSPVKQKLSLLKRTLNYFSFKFTRHVLFQKPAPRRLPDVFNVVFPNPITDIFQDIPMEKKVYWTPDFQEAHLPDLFTDDEIFTRKYYQLFNAVKTKNVVFSSKSSLADFQRLYPFAKCKTSVLHFAVTHPLYNMINIAELKSKYAITTGYFMSPNQFWVHKNHLVILKAIKLLKTKGKDMMVLFSGKEHDHRQPEYTDELKQFVAQHNLQDNVRFLGFIDRKEQLQLMNHATAIIQPSLFEGWSTVVEDAKAMDQLVIASDLEVHREQLTINGIFFNPHDEKALATIMTEVSEKKKNVLSNNYDQHIREFAETFLELI